MVEAKAAMVRCLLSMLLVVPLLLPQGVCVCDLLQKCAACAATESPAAATHDHPGCSCKKHRAKHTTTAIAQGHTCHRSAPADKQHAPGCPAKAGGGHWNFNLTHNSSLLPSAAAAPLALHPAPASLDPGRAIPDASTDQPLDLKQFNLRI